MKISWVFDILYIILFMTRDKNDYSSFKKSPHAMAKWIRKPARSGKLSNFGPAGSIPGG
jgi:hypothetical protein